MTRGQDRPREFTGRHMLMIMLAFFGVIITVNLIMATLANTSWTGLVVKNSYVASQKFNKKAEQGRAQAALGWTGDLDFADGAFSYRLRDAAGDPVRMRSVTATFRHPAYEAADTRFELAHVADRFVSEALPADGVWIVEILSDAGLEQPYRDVRRITVSNGAIR